MVSIRYVTQKQLEATIVELEDKLALLDKRLHDIEDDRKNQDNITPAEES